MKKQVTETANLAPSLLLTQFNVKAAKMVSFLLILIMILPIELVSPNVLQVIMESLLSFIKVSCKPQCAKV